MSNLLLNQSISEKVKSEVIQRNPSLWRGIVFEIIVLLSAIFLGYLFKLYVSDQPLIIIGSTPSAWLVFGTLSAFFLASLFHAVLIRDGGRRTAVQIIQILALGFFLYDESVRWLATEGVALALLLSGSWRARSELNNSLNIRFLRVAGLYYGKLVLALALMATIFYFPFWQNDRVIIPESTLDGVVGWSLGLLNNFYPEVHLTPSSTFEEVVGVLAQNEISKIPGIEKLSSVEQEKIKQQANSAITEQLSKQLGGISPQPDESLSSFFIRFLKEITKQLEDYLGQWFFVGWTVTILLIFLGLGRIYLIIMSSFAFIIYQLLLASRFINLYTETATKETLDF